jgi:hypothetical protein
VERRREDVMTRESLRSLILGLALVVTSLGVAAHAEADLTDAARATEALLGILPGHHESKRGSEFFFEIPPELATRLDPGDLLEPETESQRVVYYGGGIGFCIDPYRTAGNATTVYHFRGNRHEGALAAARNAEALGEPRDEAIWTMRRAELADADAGEAAELRELFGRVERSGRVN